PAEAGEPFGTGPTDPWPVAGGKVQVLELVRGVEKPSGYVLPLDEVSPLYGKSYREIGTDAFVNHRTQGVSLILGNWRFLFRAFRRRRTVRRLRRRTGILRTPLRPRFVWIGLPRTNSWRRQQKKPRIGKALARCT